MRRSSQGEKSRREPKRARLKRTDLRFIPAGETSPRCVTYDYTMHDNGKSTTVRSQARSRRFLLNRLNFPTLWKFKFEFHNLFVIFNINSVTQKKNQYPIKTNIQRKKTFFGKCLYFWHVNLQMRLHGVSNEDKLLASIYFI